MKNLLIMFFVLSSALSYGQSIEGMWYTKDDDGKASSHVEVYAKDGKLNAKVTKLISGDVTICTKCKDELKDKPLEGMDIIWGLEKSDENHYDNGSILNPNNGKIYDCKIDLDSPNELSVRGYLKVEVFGKTQTWYRL